MDKIKIKLTRDRIELNDFERGILSGAAVRNVFGTVGAHDERLRNIIKMLADSDYKAVLTVKERKNKPPETFQPGDVVYIKDVNFLTIIQSRYADSDDGLARWRVEPHGGIYHEKDILKIDSDNLQLFMELVVEHILKNDKF